MPVMLADPFAMPLTTLTPAFTLAQSVGTTLPEGGMIPLVIGLVAGLGLWLAGVKIIRIVFLAVGAAAGGFVGAVLMPLTGLPPFDLGTVVINPGFTGLFVGGIFGALIAMGMLRLVIILTAAGAMAVVGAMSALVFLHLTPTTPADAGYADDYADASGATNDGRDFLGRLTDEQAAQQAAKQTAEALARLNNSLPEDSTASGLIDDFNTEENRERLRDAAERSKAFLRDVSDKLKSDFDARPARDRLVILSATLAGLAFGLLVGVAMPKRSSALVTSLLGSALWLAAGVALIRANTDPDPAYLTQPPLTWAIIWTIAAVLGMAVQFGLIRRKGSKPASDQPND
jgi:hypothetical protein